MGLYKKEGHSKESAFKAVREGKQKVKIVYVKSIPKPHKKVVKKHKKHVKKVVKKHKKHVKKVVKKHKKVVKKVKKVHHKVHHVSSLKEVLVKTKEGSEKASAKSAELIKKSNLSGKEAVAKEAISKSHHRKKKTHNGEKVHKESEHKKKLGAETKAKSEIEQKLAVEKVKKKLTLKEIATKKEAPVPKKKKCNSVSSLEKYVKKCKLHEELKCSMSRKVCKKIYSVSNIREAKVAKMVDDHNSQLQAALKKTEKFEATEATKMKYDICDSAAKDMKYFSNKFLYGPIAKAATVAKAVGKHKTEAQA